MYSIAVLASTQGTDLQVIIDQIEQKELQVSLKCVISNRECLAIERAKKHKIPNKVFKPKGKDRDTFDRLIAKELTKHKVDLVVLVGYMRLLTPWFVCKYYGRIINIHPSLLPEFPGMDLNVHKEVIAAKKTKTGMTIHFVDEGEDSGPIIVQKEVAVAKDETVKTLKEKVQLLEKKWYPQVIKWFSEGKVSLKGRQVILKK